MSVTSERHIFYQRSSNSYITLFLSLLVIVEQQIKYNLIFIMYINHYSILLYYKK